MNIYFCNTKKETFWLFQKVNNSKKLGKKEVLIEDKNENPTKQMKKGFKDWVKEVEPGQIFLAEQKGAATVGMCTK